LKETIETAKKTIASLTPHQSLINKTQKKQGKDPMEQLFGKGKRLPVF